MAYSDLDPSKNLYDLSKGRESVIYRISNGTKSQEVNSIYFITNAIPAKAGDVIAFWGFNLSSSSSDNGTHLYHYSSDDVSTLDNLTYDKFIRNIPREEGYSYLEYTVPEGAQYVGIAGISRYKNNVIINKFEAPEPEPEPEPEPSDATPGELDRIKHGGAVLRIKDKKSRIEIDSLRNRVGLLEQQSGSQAEKPLIGKTINFLGDSITKGRMSSPTDIANPTFCQKIASNLGCTVNNYGVSATSVCDGSSESFVTRLNRMVESKLDALVIFGGVNDFNGNFARTLGTLSDAPAQGTNFYASFKYLILSAIKKYPSAITAVITPMRMSHESTNTYNIKLPDIVNAEIEVAQFYGVPLLDFYHYGGINPAISEQYSFTADGLHPLQTGIDLFLSPMFTEFVRSLLQYRPTVD